MKRILAAAVFAQAALLGPTIANAADVGGYAPAEPYPEVVERDAGAGDASADDQHVELAGAGFRRPGQRAERRQLDVGEHGCHGGRHLLTDPRAHPQREPRELSGRRALAGDDYPSCFAAGTAWKDIPDDWCCPDCGVREKVDFVPLSHEEATR